jgi:hypothetical protein
MQLLTNSRCESFKRCRRRHWYEYEMGLRPTEDAKALRMGSAIHAGLEVMKALAYQFGSVQEAVGTFYATDMQTEEGQYLRDIEQATVNTLLSGYAWRWQNSPLQILYNEEEFRLPLINPETRAPSTLWELAGKLDGKVRLEDGRVAVLEHKTTSEDLTPGSEWMRRLQMDSQPSMYIYAARQSDPEVATVLFDFIRKPTVKPTAVPVLDDDGLKIVADMDGKRVRNADKKAKRQCYSCYGLGVIQGDGEEVPCECTLGPWRQTADTSRQFTVQTRPMTVEEWSQKLCDDIGLRPDFYFARIEVPRLDGEVDEWQAEAWDLQKTIREAQLSGRWYRTVSRDTCPFCPYFAPCSVKTDISNGIAPEGFVFSDVLHAELSEEIQV